MSWIEKVRFDDAGLVPVVAQEVRTGEVLMLAYANREALERTVATGQAHFHSRSRGALWRKGATSGHTQEVVAIRLDCDGDAVLYQVRQTGPACHTGTQTCFDTAVQGDAADGRHILARLEAIVAERFQERPDGAYTTYLFEQGVDKILKKIGEESTEVVIAAKNPGTDELRAESADLLFHLLVLLRARGLPLEEIWNELDRRFSRSGQTPRPE